MTSFIDTNILVYAQQDGRHSARAQEILRIGGVISVQVLNEFTNVLRRKLGRDWKEIEEAIEDIRAVLAPARPVTIETHAAAMTLSREHGFSFYDALIVASAVEAGCDVLLSEDLQHGRIIAGVAIQNPFR